MIAAMLLAFGLVSLTFLFHYRVLLWLGSRGPRLGLSTQAQVLVIVVTLFLVHIAEIGIYAFTYGMSVSFLDLGVFEGLDLVDESSAREVGGNAGSGVWVGLQELFLEGGVEFGGFAGDQDLAHLGCFCGVDSILEKILDGGVGCDTFFFFFFLVLFLLC